jgi:hypothetical protein
MDDAQWARAAYARRRGKCSLPESELLSEMTPQGHAMQAELKRRREAASKEALRKSRLKRHKLFALELIGCEVKQ